MYLPEGQPSETQVWSLPVLYEYINGISLPSAADYAALDEDWKKFHKKPIEDFYKQCRILLTEEFNRGPSSHLSIQMAEKAIEAIKLGETNHRIEDGPIIYAARYGRSRSIDAICQVSINNQFDPDLFCSRTRSVFQRLGKVAGLIESQKARALTVELYADAGYLGNAYSREKGYESVRGRVLRAMVERALMDCQDPPEYVETHIMLGDVDAEERFEALGELMKGGIRRQAVAEGSDGAYPITRRFMHYAVKNPLLAMPPSHAE